MTTKKIPFRTLTYFKEFVLAFLKDFAYFFNENNKSSLQNF